MDRTRVSVLFGMVAAMMSLSVSAEECLPLNVGEVVVPVGVNRKWTFAGATPDCTIKSVWGTPGPVSLRCYDKGGAGSFTMGRDFGDLDCTGFDEFVLFFNNRGSELTAALTLDTDVGKRTSATAHIAGDWHSSWTELVVPLKGATSISNLRVALTFTKGGRAGAEIYVHGLLLRNAGEFTAFLKHWNRFSKLKWEGLIQPDGFKPQFTVSYGLFFGDDDVAAYREKYGDQFAARLDEWKTSPPPEPVIDSSIYASECAPLHVCEKYKKAFGRPCVALRQTCGALSFAALVTKDRELMRLAARYALTIASCGSWNDNTMGDIVGGGVWPAFTPSGVALELAFALDCAGEMLTPRGRDYVLKALMLKGVAPITYSMWARDFAWESNQGMVFLRGKMASLLVFDQVWPRVGPMLTTTKAEADEVMDSLFRPDGSYMESYAYMAYTIGCAAPLYEMYAHVSGKPLTKILPENLARSGGFADVIASTSRNPQRPIISIGEAHGWQHMEPLSAAFMAAAVPDSMWVNLYKGISAKELEKWYPYTGQGYGIRLRGLNKLAAAGRKAEPRPLVVLTESGLTSSTRSLRDELVKIVMVGDSLGMGKKHNDSGSFVLEYAGESFATDMPVYSGLYTEAQYHNMLVPITEGGRLANSLLFSDPTLYRVPEKRNSQRPQATGDAGSFSGTMDASDAWEDKYFRKSMRTIQSPTSEVVTITDDYELGSAATGLAFVWVTYLPAETKGGKVLITADNGARAELTIPDAATVEIERFSPGTEVIKGMSLPKDHKCSRIIIRKAADPGAQGRMEVRVRLFGP